MIFIYSYLVQLCFISGSTTPAAGAAVERFHHRHTALPPFWPSAWRPLAFERKPCQWHWMISRCGDLLRPAACWRWPSWPGRRRRRVSKKGSLCAPVELLGVHQDFLLCHDLQPNGKPTLLLITCKLRQLRLVTTAALQLAARRSTFRAINQQDVLFSWPSTTM